MDLLILKGDEGGKKREKNQVPTTTLSKTSVQNFVNLTFCVGSPQYFLEKALGGKSMKNVFFIHSPVSWGPHSSAGADATLVDRRGREEGEQMCRFRWYRDAAGKCATFVWSNPSVAHSHTHSWRNSGPSGAKGAGHLPLAREETEGVCLYWSFVREETNNHTHQCFLHRSNGILMINSQHTGITSSDSSESMNESLTHWTG